MESQKIFPTKENENIDPRYPYAFSKNLGEKNNNSPTGQKFIT